MGPAVAARREWLINFAVGYAPMAATDDAVGKAFVVHHFHRSDVTVK
jgi:hypothetical protein